jgi:hypothetical protein
MKEFRSNYEGWPTTRRYPRTIEEAYPNDPSRAEWFYKPERKRGALEYAMLSAAFWIWLGLAYWWSNT